MSSTYDHIVLGVGGIGAAAAYWLARRGPGSVLAIEQYRLGHDRGASEDHSRIIRHSYHSTDYTSLTRAAYEHVRELEDETGLPLVRLTGGLHLAPNDAAGNAEIASYGRALAGQGHAYEVMDGTEVRARWPQWQAGSDVTGLYQAETGILDIRRVNSAHISRARALGVTFLERTPVRKVVPFSGRVEVHTDEGVFEPDPEQTAEVAEFLARYLPGAVGPELVSKTCVYDLTADRNFILDTVPGQPRIGLFVGAGHAAKFAGLIGHILADLAVDETTSYPVAAFSMGRPAVRDPDYPSDFRFTRAARAATAEGSKP